MQHFEYSELEELLAVYDPKLVSRAVNSADNKTIRKLRTKIRKEVRGKYNVKAAAINRRAKTILGRVKGLSAELSYAGTKLGLVNFAAKKKKVKVSSRAGKKVTRWGTSVKVLRGQSRKVVKSKPAFVAKGKNDNLQIFARRTDDRDSIVAIKGLAIAEMVDSPEIIEHALTSSREDYEKEFDVAMNFFLGKSK